MAHVYLVIHDTCVPLQCRRWESPRSIGLLLGRSGTIRTAWRWWWRGRGSVAKAAVVVHQHKAGNHGDKNDATNPLALERHEEGVKLLKKKERKGSIKKHEIGAFDLKSQLQSRAALLLLFLFLVEGCRWNLSCAALHQQSGAKIARKKIKHASLLLSLLWQGKKIPLDVLSYITYLTGLRSVK